MSDYSSWNNKKLVDAIQKGDKMAFEFIFNLYYKPLLGYVTTFSKNREQSEDIVQQSFVSLWEKRNKLQKNISPKNYLYTIAYNNYIDFYRKEKRTNALLEDLLKENLQNRIDEDQEFLDNRILKLRKVIENLPPRCKEILYLSKQRGLEYLEISEKLKISPKTIESQIRLAFKKIRKEFENNNYILIFIKKPFKNYCR